MDNETPANIDEVFDLVDQEVSEVEETEVTMSDDDNVATTEETTEEESKVEETEEESEEESEDESKEETEETEDTEEESFTDVDPESLSEQDKEAYKRLQADYTKKRQEESNRVKELEKQVRELNSKMNPESEMTEAERDHHNEKEKLWQEDALTEINQLEPALDENSPKYDPVFDQWARAQLDKELETYAQTNKGYGYGFDYKKLIPELSKQWKEHQEKIVTNYLEKQSKARKSKATRNAKKAPKKVTPSKKEVAIDSLDDVFAAASEELGN